MLRTIITIDEAACDGCGQCVGGCHEGAIALVDGKAKLVSATYCDGLGACLATCPRGAIHTHQREADAYDPHATAAHLQRLGRPLPPELAAHAVTRVAPPWDRQAPAWPHPANTTLAPASSPAPAGHGGCPGASERTLAPPPSPKAPAASVDQPSQLRSWPVQLALVNPAAPFLRGAHLLICADCVPFAVPGFHRDHLAGKIALIGCPKLDNLPAYTEKLTAIFAQAQPASVTVMRMEVPCCGGLAHAVQQAATSVEPAPPVTVLITAISGQVMEP